MARIRTPRNIDTYIRAGEALTRLETLMRMFRRSAGANDLIKWDATFWFFNESWRDNPPPTNFLCTRARFKSGAPADRSSP